MKKKKKIYEGKVKKLYSVEEPELLIMEFKDSVSALDGEKQGLIKGKGLINKDISALLFEYLEGFHIQTHFIKSLGARDMLIKELAMIPIEVVMRNIAAGSLCTRYNLEEGKELKYPIIEFYLKDDERRDPMINQTHIISFDLASIEEVKMIERLTSKINAILKSFFMRRGLKLVDFKLEYGRYKNKVVLGDEISPDTCRLWDVKTGDKLDKDRFRFDLGNPEIAYEEVKKRVL